MTTTRSPISDTTGETSAAEQRELREGFRNLLPLIVKRLGSIPTLPDVLAYGVPILSREDLPVQEAARLVSCDPALTAKVLKVINSPLYGLRYRVSTLSHALAMLGPPVLRRIVAGVSCVEPDASDASGACDDWFRMWRHGLATALASRRIAVKVGYDLPDEAFTAGILHDLGTWVLLLYGPMAVRRARRLTRDEDARVLEAELRVLGADHTHVGSMVAERWNLPRLLRDVIRYHHDAPARIPRTLDSKSRELTGIVGAADRLVRSMGLGPEAYRDQPFTTLTVCESEELTASEVDCIQDDIRRDLDEVLDLFGMEGRRAATGEEPPRVLVPVDVIRPAHPSLASRLDALGSLLSKLRSVDDADEILPRAIAGLHRGLGFDRILYLESAAGGRRLSGRHFHDGTPVRIEMRDLELNLGDHPALERGLAPGGAEHIQAEDAVDPVLSLLGVRELIAASLTIHGKVDGILLADAFFADRELSEEDVALMKAFALAVGVLVENRGLSRQTHHLRLLAEKDELMGINNRRSLMQMLEKEVERSQVERAPLTVIMIDVDHFKRWNDVYGHQVGDHLLRELAVVVEDTARDADVVGRYGGEEFLVVLRDTRQDAGIIFAERLRREVEKLHRRLRQEYPDAKLTLSMGVAELQAEESIEELIRRVDQALYAAKERGRDRVCAGS